MLLSNKNYDRILKALLLIICGAIAVVINFTIIQDGNSIIREKRLSIEDFSVSGLEQYGKYNQLITTSNDSRAVLEFGSNIYISDIEIKLLNVSEDNWTIQVFHAVNDEGFCEEKSIRKPVTYSDDNVVLSINSEVTRIRIDFGDTSNRIIEIKSIVLNPDMRPLIKKSYVVIVFITAFLFAVLYRIAWMIKNIWIILSSEGKLSHCLPGKCTWKKFFNVAFTICVMILSVSGVSYLLSKSDSYSTRPGFYDAENCDVLLLGTSHMYDAVYPMELYRDYGISSYNLANSGERIAMSYYSLVDSIRVHHPKVVIIDMHGLEYGNYKNDPGVPKRCHMTFDAMKWSSVKVQAIKDCVEEDLWPEFFFPLYFYHNRWTELTQEDFQKRESERELSRGGNYEMGVANASEPTLIDITDHEYVENYSTEYLQKIISVCADENIEVLMIYIPFPAPESAQKKANMAYELAQCNENARYINFLYETDEIGLNYQIDTADRSSHLNPSGARKFTRYIGEYLVNNYSLTDYSGDETWAKAYQTYLSKVKEVYFEKTTNLYEYLMLMSDSDYSCFIYYSEPDILKEDDLANTLIENIDRETDLFIGELKSLDQDDIAAQSEYDDVAVAIKIARSANGQTVHVSYWNAKGVRLS